MAQQFFYREFSSANKRVDGFLRKNKRLRIIKKETDAGNNEVNYSIGFRWTLLNVMLINKVIRLTLIKIDGSVTQVKLGIIRNGEQINSGVASRTAQNLLNNLTYIF